MDKRYQVFVSSTFADLQVERQHVIQALLSLDFIPSGMELFPASDDDQWTFIKRVIDDCDYYLLILAGRYGSTDSDGLGFTEKEFDYALSVKKPVISFIHKNPGSLGYDVSEQDPKLRKKLEAFRKKAEGKMVQFWTNPDQLGARVSTSLPKLVVSHPAEGWVRARYATTANQMLGREAHLVELAARSSTQRDNPLESARGLSAWAVELLKGGASSKTGRILARGSSTSFRILAGELDRSVTDARTVSEIKSK